MLLALMDFADAHPILTAVTMLVGSFMLIAALSSGVVIGIAHPPADDREP